MRPAIPPLVLAGLLVLAACDGLDGGRAAGVGWIGAANDGGASEPSLDGGRPPSPKDSGGAELPACGERVEVVDHQDAEGFCAGLCLHQVDCPAGAPTSLRGRVHVPNGVIPLGNVSVYVPNAELSSFAEGPSCDRCATEVGGALVATTTGPDGGFELRDVPVGVTFPLVVQIGKWRRILTIDPLPACQAIELPTDATRLPRNAAEGHLPRIAVSTGGVDALECVLRKIGIDEGEFSRPAGSGRVHLFRSNGAWADAELDAECPSTCTNVDCDAAPPACRAQLTRRLYESDAMLDRYDAVIFGCDFRLHGAPLRASQWSSDDHARIRRYVNRGGRLFLSHFNFELLTRDPEFESVADFGGPANAGLMNPTLAHVDTTSPRGAAFWAWLGHIGLADAGLGPRRIPIVDPRTHARSIASFAQRWVYTTSEAHGADSVQHFTFDTPIGAAPAARCGRVVYSAFHVHGAEDLHEQAFPAHCDDGPLTPQEKLLLHMIFDLSACVRDDRESSEGPSCEPAVPVL